MERREWESEREREGDRESCINTHQRDVNDEAELTKYTSEYWNPSVGLMEMVLLLCFEESLSFAATSPTPPVPQPSKSLSSWLP